MNSREKPTTLLCTVDQCWEFKGISGFLSLYSLAVYSRSIYYSTESIRWHSIAESLMEINIKKFYTHSYIYTHEMTVFIQFYCLSYISSLNRHSFFFSGEGNDSYSLLKWALINTLMSIFLNKFNFFCFLKRHSIFYHLIFFQSYPIVFIYTILIFIYFLWDGFYELTPLRRYQITLFFLPSLCLTTISYGNFYAKYIFSFLLLIPLFTRGSTV